MTDFPTADPNTILYVDQCVERWQPFVKDVDPSRQARLSYLCEQEANHWKREIDAGESDLAARAQRGAQLKFIFPTLKRFNELLAADETEFDLTYATIEKAFEDSLPEPVWCVWGIRDCRPPEDERREILCPLVERTHAALLRFEKIVRR